MGDAGQSAASPAFVMALHYTCIAISTMSTLSAMAVTHPVLLCRTEQGLALKDLSFTWGFTGPKSQVPTSVVQRLPTSRVPSAPWTVWAPALQVAHIQMQNVNKTAPVVTHSHPMMACRDLCYGFLCEFSWLVPKAHWVSPVGQFVCVQTITGFQYSSWCELLPKTVWGSLAAVLAELLTAAAVQNWRGKKQDYTGLLSLPLFCNKAFKAAPQC